jgi:hypothetical protein
MEAIRKRWLPLAVEQATVVQRATAGQAMPAAAGHWAPRCRMRRARPESQSDAARRAWLEVSGEDDLAPSRENKELEILFLSS